LLFPGEEDFGIVPVEALSFGRPVIAYDRGGVTETVMGLRVGSQEPPENTTGIFFSKQSVDSLVEAICRFEEVEHRFCPSLIKEHADRFAPENFERHFRLFLTEKWEEFHNGRVDV
jgi:glycosyltransferase involved in cell wall biosynthesis